MAKVTFEMDEEQAAIVLAGIEGMFGEFDGRARGPELLAEQVRRAVDDWGSERADGWEYPIVKVAPLYLQLCKHVGDIDVPGAVLEAENLADFVLAVRAARRSLAEEGTEVDAAIARRR